jgi:hypothetical protein
MSTRNDTLDLLVAALKAITIENGYHTTVKTVTRYPLNNDVIKENVPYIAVIENGESVLAENATNMLYGLSIVLAGFVKGPVVGGQLWTNINNFIDDIKKAIEAPVSIGVYGLDCQIESNDIAISESELMAQLVMNVRLIYYSAKVSP